MSLHGCAAGQGGGELLSWVLPDMYKKPSPQAQATADPDPERQPNPQHLRKLLHLYLQQVLPLSNPCHVTSPDAHLQAT